VPQADGLVAHRSCSQLIAFWIPGDEDAAASILIRARAFKCYGFGAGERPELERAGSCGRGQPFAVRTLCQSVRQGHTRSIALAERLEYGAGNRITELNLVLGPLVDDTSTLKEFAWVRRSSNAARGRLLEIPHDVLPSGNGAFDPVGGGCKFIRTAPQVF